MLISAFSLHPCGADLRSVCAAARRSHPTGMFQDRLRRIGGRGGIRTHGWFNPTLDFESSALNRTQPPFLKAKIYPIRLPSEISNFKSEIFFSRTLY